MHILGDVDSRSATLSAAGHLAFNDRSFSLQDASTRAQNAVDSFCVASYGLLY